MSFLYLSYTIGFTLVLILNFIMSKMCFNVIIAFYISLYLFLFLLATSLFMADLITDCL